MQQKNQFSDLWHPPTGRRFEEVICSKFEAGTSARVSALVVQVLYGFDHLCAV